MPRFARLTLLVGIALTVMPALVGRGVAGSASCNHSLVPYAGLTGSALVATDFVTKDVPAVLYTRWSGTVPGFDGMPFSVDVTVPCGTTGPAPTIVMAHGFTDAKTVWEETGKSDRVVPVGRPEKNSRGTNAWFVTRG